MRGRFFFGFGLVLTYSTQADMRLSIAWSFAQARLARCGGDRSKEVKDAR